MRPNQRVSALSSRRPWRWTPGGSLCSPPAATSSTCPSASLTFKTPDDPEGGRGEGESGEVRYSPRRGRLSLRQAIAERLTLTRGIPFTEQEVTVCTSASTHCPAPASR